MNKATPPPPAALTEMDELRKRYEVLSKKKTVCETQLGTAEKTLQTLQAQAVAAYGTDNLDALKTRLEEMKAENQRLQDEYKASLDGIEASLKEVDKASGQAGV